MKLIVAEDADDLSRRAFALTEMLLAKTRNPAVVLPTGNTPLGLYAEAVKHGPGSRLAKARFVQLDEYLDIAADDRRSLSRWFERVLLGPLGIPRERLVSFDSATRDAAAEAARIEGLVRGSGIALAILGLGPNGHLGFNEPGSAFDSVTRAVPLTLESITSNAVYWGCEADVPRRAFTLGLGTLATAKATILLVAGAHKAAILRRVLTDRPSPDVPATCLRALPACSVIADRASLSQMSAREIAALSA